MPTAKVNGKTTHFPYTAAGRAAAAAANKGQGATRSAAKGANRSSTASARNKGQQGMAKRKAR